MLVVCRKASVSYLCVCVCWMSGVGDLRGLRWVGFVNKRPRCIVEAVRGRKQEGTVLRKKEMKVFTRCVAIRPYRFPLATPTTSTPLCSWKPFHFYFFAAWGSRSAKRKRPSSRGWLGYHSGRRRIKLVSVHQALFSVCTESTEDPFPGHVGVFLSSSCWARSCRGLCGGTKAMRYCGSREDCYGTPAIPCAQGGRRKDGIVYGLNK